MEAILGTLGLNLAGFLWHTVNFIILLALMWLVLFKPITKMLDERSRRVRDSLEHAEQVRRQTEQAEADRQTLLAEMRRESEAIRARADEQAKRTIAESQARAQTEADKILAQANANIEASRRQMLAEVRASVADLVISAVDKVTRGSVDAQAQRGMIQQFLADSPNGSGTAVGAGR